mmetsp:Transcript_24452/g.59362  ORF Transcript_24452/g.59362 Transcript_24452/m.59362 type:complete len:817 (+) Transcript_24452:1-2451(+)
MYQYSLDSFTSFMAKAMDKAPAAEELEERAANLIATIRMTIFRWVVRGLFERHKLTFNALLTFTLLKLGKLKEEYPGDAPISFLFKGPMRTDVENTLGDWLPNTAWFAVQKLIELDGFDSFAQNMEKDAPTRFKEWFNEVAPEEQKLPLDWKRLENEPLKKMLVLRCLRPDRITIAMADWIRGALPNGRDYMDCDGSSSFMAVLTNSYEDTSPATPIFFILSPGSDPVQEVEKMGQTKMDPPLKLHLNYHNVAMGQGQDVVAMAKLEMGHKDGHWVMLQNIHLMPSWCVTLEKKMDNFNVEGSHPAFRIYLSADPSKGIPIGILERAVKLTNEPPTGLNANLRRGFAFFNKEDFEERDAKVKAILFGLCHFHAIMLERKKFGPMGYNMMYPFSVGDLRDSASVLYNYLENNQSAKIPWADLRYIFGEVMYGGHIVDDWDRVMCKCYLEYFFVDEILDETQLVPYAEDKLSLMSPPPGPHEKYLEFIEAMPGETPLFFGMHPNAEINYRTVQCNNLFDMLIQLQPRDTSGGEEAGESQSPMARAEQLCSDILDDVRDIKFPTDDISKSLSDEEKGPFQFVFLQEADYMNGLVGEMIRSLSELQLGFRGELTMSEQMEKLVDSLFLEKIPEWWMKLGFPTVRSLASWLANLKERCEQLDNWCNDPVTIPKVTDISRLFNPQSFLTAIKQITCQVQSLELNKLQVVTEITKRDVKQIETLAREGAYVCGLYLEGARWDMAANSLEDSKPKEMFCKMPVVQCKAGMASEKEDKNIYQCPTYCTPTRRPYYVFPAQLRTKYPPPKWTLAGVALILDIGFAL